MEKRKNLQGEVGILEERRELVLLLHRRKGIWAGGQEGKGSREALNLLLDGGEKECKSIIRGGIFTTLTKEGRGVILRKKNRDSFSLGPGLRREKRKKVPTDFAAGKRLKRRVDTRGREKFVLSPEKGEFSRT